MRSHNWLSLNIIPFSTCSWTTWWMTWRNMLGHWQKNIFVDVKNTSGTSRRPLGGVEKLFFLFILVWLMLYDPRFNQQLQSLYKISGNVKLRERSIYTRTHQAVHCWQQAPWRKSTQLRITPKLLKMTVWCGRMLHEEWLTVQAFLLVLTSYWL